MVRLFVRAKRKGKNMRYLRFLMGTLVTVGLLAILAGSPVAAMDPPGLDRAIVAQEAHSAQLLAHPKVVGTAVGWTADGAAAVTIFTETLGVGGLPRSLDGVPVVVQVTGKLLALHHRPGHSKGGGSSEDETSGAVDPTALFPRPVPIGVSSGSVESIVTDGLFISCSTGTLGARVTAGANVFALSNYHVYAPQDNSSTLGSDIVQPGPADADPVCADKSGAETIGHLTAFKSLQFTASDCTEGASDPDCNTMDAAIALSDTANLGNATPSDGYGTPKSAIFQCDTGCTNLLNTRVQKYGRTSSLTKGTITGVNAIVNVSYSSGTARFVDQIVVEGRKGGFIKGGDSGALLVRDPENNPVGLLFAGSRSGKIAVASRIDLVLDEFSVTIDGD